MITFSQSFKNALANHSKIIAFNVEFKLCVEVKFWQLCLIVISLQYFDFVKKLFV